MTNGKPANTALESLDLDIWKRAIKPRLKLLTQSEKENLGDNDVFAWLLQQAGYLHRGEIEKAELNVIAVLFMDQATEHLREGRFQLRELMKTLLILCSSSSVKSRQQPSLLDDVANQRYFVQKLLRDSPSMIDFLDDMIRFAWRGARTGAINTLSIRKPRIVWEHQIPESNPFTVGQILAYDPFDKQDYLVHTKTLPPQRFHP